MGRCGRARRSTQRLTLSYTRHWITFVWCFRRQTWGICNLRNRRWQRWSSGSWLWWDIDWKWYLHWRTRRIPSHPRIIRIQRWLRMGWKLPRHRSWLPRHSSCLPRWLWYRQWSCWRWWCDHHRPCIEVILGGQWMLTRRLRKMREAILVGYVANNQPTIEVVKCKFESTTSSLSRPTLPEM